MYIVVLLCSFLCEFKVIFFLNYSFPTPLTLRRAKFEELEENRYPVILLTHPRPPQDRPLLHILGGLGKISMLGFHLGTSFCEPLGAAVLVDL